jgi:hypothetical protein
MGLLVRRLAGGGTSCAAPDKERSGVITPVVRCEVMKLFVYCRSDKTSRSIRAGCDTSGSAPRVLVQPAPPLPISRYCRNLVALSNALTHSNHLAQVLFISSWYSIYYEFLQVWLLLLGQKQNACLGYYKYNYCNKHNFLTFYPTRTF